MTTFDQVVKAWDLADVTHIHPLRNVSDIAYWDSGRAQAEQAAAWVPCGGTVLDFGCGDGRLSFPLARMGFDTICVDASKAMIRRVRQRAKELDLTMLDTIVSDGLNLSEMVTPVDVVVARAVLIHHAHEDVIRLVHALARIIKPGGFLVADWPLGGTHERTDWIDVTTWDRKDRNRVAHSAGLELVEDETPSVWRKL